MKMFFEAYMQETISNYNYVLEVNCIIYNYENLGLTIIETLEEDLANKIIDDINSNQKYIKDALNIPDFEISIQEINSPTILLNFESSVVLNEDDLYSVLGRFTQQEIEDTFTDGEEEYNLKLKTIRNELKIYPGENLNETKEV